LHYLKIKNTWQNLLSNRKKNVDIHCTFFSSLLY